MRTLNFTGIRNLPEAFTGLDGISQFLSHSKVWAVTKAYDTPTVTCVYIYSDILKAKFMYFVMTYYKIFLIKIFRIFYQMLMMLNKDANK